MAPAAFIWMSTSGPPTFQIAPFVGCCTLGVGSKYPVALRDANGEFPERLEHLQAAPPAFNPPAALLRAVTAYNITDGTMWWKRRN